MEIFMVGFWMEWFLWNCLSGLSFSVSAMVVIRLWLGMVSTDLRASDGTNCWNIEQDCCFGRRALLSF